MKTFPKKKKKKKKKTDVLFPVEPHIHIMKSISKEHTNQSN